MARALPLAVLLLVAPAFAGCAAFGGEPEPTTSTELLPGELPDATTPGKVRGLVTDASLAPLGGVEVLILGLNRTMTTGIEGIYRFDDLPNGRHLLHAKREGFFGKTQSATAKNGTVVTLDFRLEAIPVAIPYDESVEFAGLISCDGMVRGPQGTQPVHCGNTDPNDLRVFETDIKGDAKTLVLEVVWDASTPASQRLFARMETVGFGAQDAILAEGLSTSVLRLEVPASNLAKYYARGGTVRIAVEPAPSLTQEEAGTDAGLAVQQSFTVYLTAFYHEAAPAGFSVLQPE